jgi:hypothetical protein
VTDAERERFRALVPKACLHDAARDLLDRAQEGGAFESVGCSIEVVDRARAILGRLGEVLAIRAWEFSSGFPGERRCWCFSVDGFSRNGTTDRELDRHKLGCARVVALLTADAPLRIESHVRLLPEPDGSSSLVRLWRVVGPGGEVLLGGFFKRDSAERAVAAEREP